jgi:hypothetical protein
MEQHRVRAEAGRYRWKRWRWAVVPAAVFCGYLALAAR